MSYHDAAVIRYNVQDGGGKMKYHNTFNKIPKY